MNDLYKNTDKTANNSSDSNSKNAITYENSTKKLDITDKTAVKCYICPRKCGAKRANGEIGFCGCGQNMLVAKVMLHTFEEPCISGTRGSGAIFFCGCNLRCGYCQNAAISNFSAKTGNAEEYSVKRLADTMLQLQQQNAHNINLVTAAHFVNNVADAIKLAKNNGLKIPVVYNSSGYELISAIKLLDGLVDVYLPDYKYYSSSLAQKYSAAPDYPQIASEVIAEMLRQQPSCKFDDSGIILSGVIIRHLVLPAQKQDSCNIVKNIAQNYKGALLSLMSQYTPDFNKTGDTSLDRRVTTYEYNSVLNLAADLNIDGYMQLRSSSQKKFTPDF